MREIRVRPVRAAVSIEAGGKRTFAAALDWPGWCRSGPDETAALDALRIAAPRYASVAKTARVAFSTAAVESLTVVERLPGSASTDFGVPSAIAAADRQRLDAEEASRLVTLVRAAWTVFDRVVATAPSELRKGPRGGGRDRDAILAHAVGAEREYARKLGLTWPTLNPEDAAAVKAMREALAAQLSDSTGDGVWPSRYGARRIAWHVLDHAWEIEDRSDAS